MNLTRLMVLGVLAARGPMHGHQIRRSAEVTNVESWGGVSVGSLYRELHAMEGEALVEALRSEQVGRRPARTVYSITEEGRLELHILGEQAVKDLRYGPDSLGVALLFGGLAGKGGLLTELLRHRRQEIANQLEALVAERRRGVAQGWLDPIAAAVFRRGEIRLEAELAWHEEFSRVLDDEGVGELPAHTMNGAS
ncbi:MAG: PadR family transcriptional regulator [Acidimicrobiales bacterium]